MPKQTKPELEINIWLPSGFKKGFKPRTNIGYAFLFAKNIGHANLEITDPENSVYYATLNEEYEKQSKESQIITRDDILIKGKNGKVIKIKRLKKTLSVWPRGGEVISPRELARLGERHGDLQSHLDDTESEATSSDLKIVHLVSRVKDYELIRMGEDPELQPGKIYIDLHEGKLTYYIKSKRINGVITDDITEEELQIVIDKSLDLKKSEINNSKTLEKNTFKITSSMGFDELNKQLSNILKITVSRGHTECKPTTSEKTKYNLGCNLLVIPGQVSTTKESLKALNLQANAAYIRTGKEFIYVNKSLGLIEKFSSKKRKAFDKLFEITEPLVQEVAKLDQADLVRIDAHINHKHQVANPEFYLNGHFFKDPAQEQNLDLSVDLEDAAREAKHTGIKIEKLKKELETLLKGNTLFNESLLNIIFDLRRSLKRVETKEIKTLITKLIKNEEEINNLREIYFNLDENKHAEEQIEGKKEIRERLLELKVKNLEYANKIVDHLKINKSELIRTKRTEIEQQISNTQKHLQDFLALQKDLDDATIALAKTQKRVEDVKDQIETTKQTIYKRRTLGREPDIKISLPIRESSDTLIDDASIEKYSLDEKAILDYIKQIEAQVEQGEAPYSVTEWNCARYVWEAIISGCTDELKNAIFSLNTLPTDEGGLKVKDKFFSSPVVTPEGLAKWAKQLKTYINQLNQNYWQSLQLVNVENIEGKTKPAKSPFKKITTLFNKMKPKKYKGKLEGETTNTAQGTKSNRSSINLGEEAYSQPNSLTSSTATLFDYDSDVSESSVTSARSRKLEHKPESFWLNEDNSSYKIRHPISSFFPSDDTTRVKYHPAVGEQFESPTTKKRDSAIRLTTSQSSFNKTNSPSRIRSTQSFTSLFQSKTQEGGGSNQSGKSWLDFKTSLEEDIKTSHEISSFKIFEEKKTILDEQIKAIETEISEIEVHQSSYQKI